VTYLLDTDVVISYLNGRREAVSLVDGLRAEGIALSVITYGEVLEGLLRSSDSAVRRADFDEFVRGAPLIPVIAGIMNIFAEIRRELRAGGQLIDDMDLLIAATALEQGCILVTRNRRHFERVPTLLIHQET